MEAIDVTDIVRLRELAECLDWYAEQQRDPNRGRRVNSLARSVRAEARKAEVNSGLAPRTA